MRLPQGFSAEFTILAGKKRLRNLLLNFQIIIMAAATVHKGNIAPILCFP
jgi:hypothetical protein